MENRDQKIVIRLQAHNILTQANMEKGYTRDEASKAAFTGIKQMPKDVQISLCKRIMAGDAECIDLFRWPMKYPKGRP